MGRPIMPQTMHVLALAGALCSAAATIFIRQGLRTSDPFSGFWINLLVGTISLWVAVLVTGGLGRVSAPGRALLRVRRPDRHRRRATAQVRIDRESRSLDRCRPHQPESFRIVDSGHRPAR